MKLSSIGIFAALLVGLFASLTTGSATRAESAPIAGFADALTRDVNRAGYSNGVQGWAYDPSDPTADVQVSMSIDGTMLVAASADGARQDVDAALHIGSNHGFTAPIEDFFFDGQRHELRLYMENLATNARVELQGSPLYFAAYDPGVKGVIDVIGRENPQQYETFVRGWAFDANDTSTSIAVVAFQDDYRTGKMLGSGVADIARTDVDDAFGSGTQHGYAMPLNLATYVAGDQIVISVYAVDLSVGELRLLGTMAHAVE